MEDHSSIWIDMRLPLLASPYGDLGRGNSMGLIFEARSHFLDMTTKGLFRTSFLPMASFEKLVGGR